MTPDALRERVRYILDPSASAVERLNRRAHLTNRDLRMILAALDATPLAEMQEEIERLREALRPFKLAADMADQRMLGRYLNTDLPDDTTVLGALNLTLGHIRQARAALGDGKVVG